MHLARADSPVGPVAAAAVVADFGAYSSFHDSNLIIGN